MSTVLRDISSVDAMPSHIESSSRIFGLNNGKATYRSSLLSHDINRLNMPFGSSNTIENMSLQRSKNSAFQSTTLASRPFGFHSRNFNLNSTPIPEASFRLNHDIKQRNNITSTTSAISKPFSPAVRNTTLTTGLQMQDTMRYNDDNNDSVFRRPTLSRIIRGRSSTLQSRLFHNQNAERHYKDLSNINGFNVSHISRRETDTSSDSRFGLGMRSNWMDNQSVAGSVLSVASMKAQFMNLLENLHHSILNIGPRVTAEAVRMEFDKAKQGLENISEMSFAPSVRPTDSESVISQSSRVICPAPINETAKSNITNRKSFIPTSSFDILKKLISSKNNSSSTQVEKERQQEIVITSSVNVESDEEENSSLVFKKPKPFVKKSKNLQGLIIKAPQPVRTLISKATNKSINLTQWYPIADGPNLTFCGVDEEGVNVKTDAVKKRLNNRKVELVSGLDCNLVGSPSPKISALPPKIGTMLKKGLTDRWRVLQRELLSCQTAGETKKCTSESPKVKSSTGKSSKKSNFAVKKTAKSPKKTNSANLKVATSPKKLKSPTVKAAKSPKATSSEVKKIMKTPNRNKKKGKSNNKKIISTPKKKLHVAEMQTRSGRIVKPPAQFWLATGSNEVSSSLGVDSTMEESSIQSARSLPRTPVKKPSSESQKIYKNVKSSSPKAKSSPKKRKEAEKKEKRFPRRKPSKMTSSKKNEKMESEEEVEVHSSTEDAKRQKKFPPQGKRKREIAGETDSVQTKKSKLEKVTEVEVESTIETAKPVTKKKKNGKLSLSPRSPKPESRISLSTPSKPREKKKKTVKKETVKKTKENKKETSDVMEVTEFEKNFEFQLDDIDIPEIGNISGNPQLSRSQLRLISVETPPLKYFNSNLRLLRSATPVRSPDWTISQRTESEVKQFQRRREEAFKRKTKIDIKKTVINETKSVQSKDVKKVMEWVAEKNVKSPQFGSEVLQFVLRGKKQIEEEDDEDVETDFF